MKDEPIYVTKPFLPPLEEYQHLLSGVWERGVLTHNGPLVQQFEKDFNQKFGINQFVAVSNGTVSLQLAIRALGLRGEIITTPFTWVATISAILWEYCTPVFVDIDPETLNLDPKGIEAKINKNTVAIMPVHVFGNACEVTSIQEIASQYGLKVIYDSAHAVGVNYKGRSLLEFGDISAVSFHATKLLNTAEGGGCITTDNELYQALKALRFFGHNEEKSIEALGMNGKMTEIHAALGMIGLQYFDQIIEDRRNKYNRYLQQLSGYLGITFQRINPESCNFSYFPLIFHSQEKLQQILNKLNQQKIFPRRYFYPSVNTFSKVVKYESMPIAESISNRIVCLPLYFDLSNEQLDKICELIADCI